MGIEVADISEFAALRPIQTAAVSGALAMPDEDAAAAADSGCVTRTVIATAGAAEDDGAAANGIGCATPTAAERIAGPQRDAGADDTIYATPTACRTTAPLDGNEFDGVAAAAFDAAVNFTTPTSDESALRPATVCPPAPRKLAPALKRKLSPLQQRLFYPVPSELATVFKPAPPPPVKKMRPAHAVGSSVPLDISELAALRPIQTTAVSGTVITAAGADDRDGPAVAETGCVTPPSSRERAKAWAAEGDGAAADSIGYAMPTAAEQMAAPKWDSGADDGSNSTPRACRTTAPLVGCEFNAAEAAVNFTTPTSDQSALRPATVCPAAPQKLAPALKRKLAPLQQRLFYPVPRDLAIVFKSAPPPAKKMRPAHA